MSDYPALSKLIPAPWFKSKMNCNKKVAFEYVGANARFQTAFARAEKLVQDIFEEALGELEHSVEENMSNTAKKKIGVMSKQLKKESDEKKVKKAKEKYGIDIVDKGKGTKEEGKDGKEEDDESDPVLTNDEIGQEMYEENDKPSSSSSSSSSGQQPAKSTLPSSIMSAAEELFGSSRNGESKRPMMIDTSSSSMSNDGDGKLVADLLTPTPKNTDVPLVHKKLLRFSKANMFGVFDKDGVPLHNEITIDSENKIHVAVSQ
jgi:hypothetical protein